MIIRVVYIIHTHHFIPALHSIKYHPTSIAMPKRKKRKTAGGAKGGAKSLVTKRLQTELQSLIAYACYDSKEVLQGGESGTKTMIINRLYEAYMPSNLANDDRISFVEMFLEGSNKFKYLFESFEDSDSEIGRDPHTDRPSSQLVLPESLHCINGAEIVVGRGCITKSLITRKNLSNMVDIKADTLFRSAKVVEANCKKALAICVAKDSPYRDFDGIWPSGTNWDDYLLWIREKMYKLENSVKVDVIDDDDDAESNDAEGNDEDTNDVASVCSNIDEDDEEIPSDTYFKGFFAFALWGYIPPAGGENYKSSLMATVVDKGLKRNPKDGRAAVRKEKKEDKDVTQVLEARGTPKAIEAEGMRFKTITDIMVKGRQELNKQKLFKLSLNKIEFELRYAGERIGEIKEEIKELKEMMEDGVEDDDESTQSNLKNLRTELKKTRERKKELFHCWKNTTSSEEERRILFDAQDDKDITLTSVTQSTTNTRAALSPITMADSIDERIQAVTNAITVADDCVPVNLNLKQSILAEEVTQMTDDANN